MNPVLQVEEVTKTYGGRGEKKYQALKGISFKLNKGEFVGIMGASGSGKTTLLNILSTLDQPSSGRVLLKQQDLTALKGRRLAAFRGQQIGFIFQDFNLLANLTNQENIALPLALQGMPARKTNDDVQRIASQLGIEDILAKYPAEISGGQKQRVAAARALVHRPQILYGDEPTGSLDSKAATELLQTMTALNQRQGISILMVTHDPYSASYAQRILFIKDGRIGRQLRKNGRTRAEFYQDIIAELERR